MYYYEYKFDREGSAVAVARSLRRAGVVARRRGTAVRIFGANSAEIINEIKKAWMRIGVIPRAVLVDWGHDMENV